MSERSSVLSYSTWSTVQGCLRLRTLIMHKQVTTSRKRYTS